MITKEKTIAALKQCMDPELGVDVWTLGLIYDVDIKGTIVAIKMTFTSPMCPYGPLLVQDITNKVKKAGSTEVKIEVVFEPMWKPSEEVKQMLGMAEP
jgi:metal-sulfur cluster biosynthetic enzyme